MQYNNMETLTENDLEVTTKRRAQHEEFNRKDDVASGAELDFYSYGKNRNSDFVGNVRILGEQQDLQLEWKLEYHQTMPTNMIPPSIESSPHPQLRGMHRKLSRGRNHLPKHPAIQVSHSCLLVPVFFAVWWYYTKRVFRQVKGFIRSCPEPKVDDDELFREKFSRFEDPSVPWENVPDESNSERFVKWINRKNVHRRYQRQKIQTVTQKCLHSPTNNNNNTNNTSEAVQPPPFDDDPATLLSNAHRAKIYTLLDDDNDDDEESRVGRIRIQKNSNNNNTTTATNDMGLDNSINERNTNSQQLESQFMDEEQDESEQWECLPDIGNYELCSDYSNWNRDSFGGGGGNGQQEYPSLLDNYNNNNNNNNNNGENEVEMVSIVTSMPLTDLNRVRMS